ncbi:MAG: NYN domain-containing protein [Firmicutes bacterium]|nr:NYN domain-containing protein [Bacillota bacterium]
MKNQVFTLGRQLHNYTQAYIQAVAYVDYQNILDLLKRYGTSPAEINFFRVIQDNLKQSGINVIDFIAYGDFDKNTENAREQTYLRNIGLQTRHSSINGKNTGDLELTVNALQVLYKNPSIQVFVFITSGRDLIPLLKAIKYENKYSYVFSTKTGFNPVIAEYADFHQYVEDVFQLNPETKGPVYSPISSTLAWDFDYRDINEAAIARAREVSNYLYRSNIWKKYTQTAEPINLHGYIQVISKIIHRSPDEILNDFKVAHYLKYVTIYSQSGQLYVKQGLGKDSLSLKTG